jgi:glycosyltransferase involved in cell wall biosynthesis
VNNIQCSLDNSITDGPLVSVGIPTYNRPEGLRRTLEYIIGQTYKNLEIIVSDNCSPNLDVETVGREFAEKDHRVTYFRQKENTGVYNFEFVLEKATGEYFMWAADDDEWDKEFISACVPLLQKNSNIGVAFCNIVNTDPFGRVIRDYPPIEFENFTGPNIHKTIFNYLKSPEILGKANIVYGLYRLKLIKELWETCPLSADWGSDMCFVLGGLARSGLAIDNRVLFLKSIPHDTDIKERIDKIIIKNPKNHIFPFIDSITYLKNNLNAVKGTKYYWLTLFVIVVRIPRSFVIFISNKAMFGIRYIIRRVASGIKRNYA